MDSNLVEKISATDYNAEKYVRELSQRWVGCHELRQQRKAVQSLSETTNVSLKKNVYDNYTQFIETAKEITHLESEMYQLSHLLSEQKALLDAIYNSNIHADVDATVFPDKTSDAEKTEEQRKNEEEESRRRKLTAILEKVEGCSGLLEVKGRTLLHEGDLIECDPVENTPLHKLHAYLFNDALMLALWIKDRRGPAVYKMYKMYDISSLAVVNVRDVPAVKVAFKILAFPDTKLFTCPSAKAKKEWLECFDLAKKQRLASEKLKRETLQSQSSFDSTTKSSSQSQSGVGTATKSANQSQNSADVKSTNPFDRESSLSQTSIDSPSAGWEDSYQKMMAHQPQLPDWFLESPEDLEVFIAERHFESALELLIKSKDFCKSFAEPNDPVFIGIREKTETQRRQLTEALVKELQVSPEKSLQGGLRAARRVVRLLNALGRQTQACQLMLELCTSIVKKELKSVKREGSCVVYVTRLGNQLYSTVLEVASELTRAFESAQPCIAALVVWTHAQIAQFVGHVVKQVFVPQVPLATVADCVSSLRSQNSQLSECGMDLQYEMEGILHRPITVAVRDSKDKAAEALRHRAADDQWRPLNLHNKASRNKLLHELSELQVEIPPSFIRGECWLELTGNTVAFIRMLMSFVDDCCKLHSQHLHHVVEDAILELFRFQLRLMDSVLHSPASDGQVEVIHKNGQFLLEHFVGTVCDVFEARTGMPSTKLASLTNEFSHLMRPKPKPRQQTQASLPKYSSEEFI